MAPQRQALTDVDPYAPTEPEATIPVFRRNQAPAGLATKRQLRGLGLRPGGQDPVAEVETRGPKNGLLYEIATAKPVRPMTLAREFALDRAMAARETCKRYDAITTVSRSDLASAWSVTTAPPPTPPATPFPQARTA
ncbi:RRQRL motif-containing zinc-binding protein [Streptomyces sp. NBC_00467]|uniref:RRQRL motif-containing zinc-binding protein n=1 Tax=Streptomyces sp. NBC_00467 TaxID=2975752 RepID=UPI002E177D83